MTKKRDGKRAKKRVKASVCGVCGHASRASGRRLVAPGFAHKLGTIPLPCGDRTRPLSPEEAIAIAREVGVIDEFGNLTPEYQ